MRTLSFIHNAVRAKEIIAILLRHGFDDLLTKIGTPQGLLRRFVKTKAEGLTMWQRVRRVCEDLGPTFVKVAQLLSTRPDVLPQDLIRELKQLRDQVRPVDFEKIRPLLERELGGKVEEFFEEFSPHPTAAGSLAQIHKARLRANQKPVAVKIQRPKIRDAVISDLEIIGWFARQLHENIAELRPYDLPAVIEETKSGLIRELDFTNEANNAEIFNTMNPFPDEVFAPAVYEESLTPRLLVMEWVEGKPPDRAELEPNRAKAVAAAGGNSIFHQIVIAGFFHADPHSGNILITPEGRICFLDWGLVGQLTRFMRYFLADLLSAITAQDAEKVVRVASRMSRSNRYIDTLAMEKQITILLRRYQKVAVTGDAIGNLILEMVYVFGSNGIHIAQDYTLLARAVTSLEETARALDPEFKLAKTAEPFLRQLTVERWNPVSMLRQSYWGILSALQKLQELPGDVQRVLRRIESEDLKVKLHHEGVKRLDELLSSATNRLVLAMVIAALIIGSSLVITTGVRPHIFGYPAIGLVGYLLSGLLGFWIIIDILRHGRHR